MADRSSPKVVRTVNDLRALVSAWREVRTSVGLVTTMGALHRGHAALIDEARNRAGRVLVSVFVNPAQFGPNEDFAAYPRDEAKDLAELAAAGVDAVYAPSVDEMYPPGFATSVVVAGPALGLETDFRPQFFTGVATVVAKLLNSALPDCAIFGEKDYQQLLVVGRMVADLNIPVDIIAHPTVREADGLALSSRNAYLSPEDRKTAPKLFAVLNDAALSIRGQVSAVDVMIAGDRALTGLGFRVDYFVVRNSETLAAVVDPGSEPMRVLAAAWLGKTRLIDNVAV
jgi:pantoate--beta-alanine ligase